MTRCNVDGIIEPINCDMLAQSVSEMKMRELVENYKALLNAIDVSMRCADLPVSMFMIMDIANVYAVEIANRVLFTDGREILYKMPILQMPKCINNEIVGNL